MNHYSPLRYPGGKAKVANYIKSVIALNNINSCRYIEPYAGGASVALDLIYLGYAKEAIINDYDRSIYAFWKAVLDFPEQLAQLIWDTPLNVATWETQKAIQSNKKDAEILELGFSTFYINRVNRSGIMKAGLIGGRNQDGRWKMDARYNKPNLVERIYHVASFRDRLEIRNEDAVELLNNLSSVGNESQIIYFDPPYYVKGQDLYVNFYNEKDHELLAKRISEIQDAHWIVSYDDHEFITNLYSEYRKIQYGFNYSTTASKRGHEVMFFSENLKVPDFKNPTKVTDHCVRSLEESLYSI